MPLAPAVPLFGHPEVLVAEVELTHRRPQLGGRSGIVEIDCQQLGADSATLEGGHCWLRRTASLERRASAHAVAVPDLRERW
jgi:hypothetical protein